MGPSQPQKKKTAEPESQARVAQDEHEALLDWRWANLLKLGFSDEQADRIVHLNDVEHTAAGMLERMPHSLVVEELT